jgi:xanthine dehydrogenase large subunit
MPAPRRRRGADINGAAINNACDQLRERLKPVAARLLKCEPDAVEFIAGYAHAKGADPASGNDTRVPWPQVVKHAWLDRVGLSVTGFYMTPDIAYDFQSLQGRAFYYFCYGAAVTEVEIDTRTGSGGCRPWTSCTTWGINPGHRQGPDRGAHQGMGWLTMEECIWDRNGKLLTHGPHLQDPGGGDIPEHFKVSLFDGRTSSPRPTAAKPWRAAADAGAVSALRGARCGQRIGRAQGSVDLVPAPPERILLACERALALG